MQLAELLKDHQTGMSEFQHDVLVTKRAGGTLYGQYKQALRELYRRLRGMREILCNRERLIVDIDEIKFKLDKEDHSSGFQKARLEIDLTKKIMLMEESDRAFNDAYREFVRFYQQAAALKEKIGDLTPEKRALYEKEMWVFRVKEKMVIDLITTGRLSGNTYEFFQALPMGLKVLVANDLKHQDQLMEWYEGVDRDYLPGPDELIKIEAPRIALDSSGIKQLQEIV